MLLFPTRGRRPCVSDGLLSRKEGKSGAIVARTSTDYGKTWTQSINISENQHLFGLAVAPNSRYAAVRVGNKIRLRYLVNPNSSWSLKTNFAKEDHAISSHGLSLISNGSRVVVSYIGSNALSEKKIHYCEWTMA
jgi:hypothetical protein